MSEPGSFTGAQLIWESLIREGVDTVFGYPGGAILPTYDAMTEYTIRHVLVRHEQSAVHMADGYARASGRVGVVVATSGPGATNLVTGLATAMLDSTPLVAITGQVGSALLGTGEGSWFGHALLLHGATVMAPSEALVTVAAYLAKTPLR